MRYQLTYSITRVAINLLPLALGALAIGCSSNDGGSPVTLGPDGNAIDTDRSASDDPAANVDPATNVDPAANVDPNDPTADPGAVQSEVPVDPNSADELLFQDALARYTALDYAGAEQLFDDLLASYPESPRTDNAKYLAGRSAYAIGITAVGSVDMAALTRAEAAFTAVLTQFPNSPFTQASHYYLGRTRFSETDFAGALPEFRLSAADPNGLFADNAQYYVGRTHFELNELALAESQLSLLITRYPNSTYLDNGTYYRGRALFGLQRHSEALVAFESVAAFTGSIFLDNALYYHGRTRYAQLELAAALSDFDALLTGYADSGYRDNAFYYRARVQTDQNDCTAASATLADLRAEFPASSYATRTEAYLSQNGC